MRVHYAVTFEFETRAPMTHRGIIDGAHPETGAFRAVREARKALRPVGWTSFVYVALSRDLDDARGIVEPAEVG